jgi:competence protein ComEA
VSRRWRLIEVWALVVFALAIRALGGGLLGADSAPALEVRPHRVDLDRATVAELRVLPGIGSVRAEAIVLERIRRGPFDGIDELARVPGIGPETAAEMAPWLWFVPPPGEGGHDGAGMADAVAPPLR